MKSTLLALMLLVLAFACKKDDSTTPTVDVATQVTQGVWKVTSFIDNNKRDRTSKYATYSFTFSSNGNLKITYAGAAIQGTWSTVKEGVKDRLILTFATSVPEEITDLNDNWYIMDKTDSSMKLQKINGYWETGSVQKEMMFTKS